MSLSINGVVVEKKPVGYSPFWGAGSASGGLLGEIVYVSWRFSICESYVWTIRKWVGWFHQAIFSHRLSDISALFSHFHNGGHPPFFCWWSQSEPTWSRKLTRWPDISSLGLLWKPFQTYCSIVGGQKRGAYYKILFYWTRPLLEIFWNFADVSVTLADDDTNTSWLCQLGNLEVMAAMAMFYFAKQISSFISHFYLF